MQLSHQHVVSRCLPQAWFATGSAVLCVHYPRVRAGCSQKGCSCPHRCIAGVSLALALVFTWSSGGLGPGVKWAAKEAFCRVSSTSGSGDTREGVGVSGWGAVVAACLPVIWAEMGNRSPVVMTSSSTLASRFQVTQRIWLLEGLYGCVRYVSNIWESGGEV